MINEEEYLRGYKQGFKDRAKQSDLEHKTCENCRYCDEFKDDILHCNYFEQFFPAEIGKCDKWKHKGKLMTREYINDSYAHIKEKLELKDFDALEPLFMQSMHYLYDELERVEKDIPECSNCGDTYHTNEPHQCNFREEKEDEHNRLSSDINTTVDNSMDSDNIVSKMTIPIKKHWSNDPANFPVRLVRDTEQYVTYRWVYKREDFIKAHRQGFKLVTEDNCTLVGSMF